MDNFIEKGGVVITGHIRIKDTQTDEILLNMNETQTLHTDADVLGIKRCVIDTQVKDNDDER